MLQVESGRTEIAVLCVVQGPRQGVVFWFMGQFQEISKFQSE